MAHTRLRWLSFFVLVLLASSLMAGIAGTPTNTSLISSVNPSIVGQNVTFTATVSGFDGTPTGTVTFFDGLTNLGTSPLVAGVATFSTAGLTQGAHVITARYNGDSTYVTSTSAPLTQNVNPAAVPSEGQIPALEPRALAVLVLLMAVAAVVVLKR